jgi:hypothetical protein
VITCHAAPGLPAGNDGPYTAVVIHDFLRFKKLWKGGWLEFIKGSLKLSLEALFV